jgi:flagellar L-ring protein precursor FlgH
MIRALLCCAVVAVPAAASAENLYRHDDWAALASDRRARNVGDIITVIVMQSASAANTVRTGTRRESRLGGEIGVSDAIGESASLGLRGSFTGDGQTARSGRMVAQMSVTVTEVYPNGDLGVAGAQLLNINGERTNIRLRGRVRGADIGSGNTVLSARLADAAIDYDGSGFVSRSARPGLLQRIFNFLGLM